MGIEMIAKNYGYVGPGTDLGRIHITNGQFISGHTIGILVQDVHYPLLPGNVVNGYTYDFPVRLQVVPGANQARMHVGDQTLIPDLVATAKLLEQEGCRAICAGCGYFGHFQKSVADQVDIPVYLSSMVQVPWVSVALKSTQKIGILCADQKNLTQDVFNACGVSEEIYNRCCVAGAGHLPEFSALLERRGHFDNEILRQELIDLAKNLLKNEPDIGAILLECSDMPPYAAAIQQELALPVYDYITMIKYAHSAVAQRPYYGFM